jgi:tRNA nucleotidyltransferase (CCA-adding enzyme)
MQTYIVGGAVRDALLGLPVNDHDWVVVGATPQEMITSGYLPVGKDFPVFLHPETREEYALARTERKTARGYHGFAFHAEPDVTLEQDLARRDLTVNAMAQDEKGRLIDPYGGQADLKSRVLRHVTHAFREDPVRILRVARFAARFADFSLAPETLALMREMVQAGEVDALVAERVWQELSRGLMEGKPSRMFEVLRECGALERLLPEVDRLWGVPQRAEYHPEVDTGVHLMMVLDMSARLSCPLPVRFACLTHDLGKGTTPAEILPKHIGHEERSAGLLRDVCDRLRIPTECRELADVVAREHGNIHRSAEFGAAALVRLLERCDAFRKPQRFDQVLLACECDARGRLGLEEKPYSQRARLLAALAAAQAVATHEIAAQAQQAQIEGPKIGEMIHKARVRSVAQLVSAGGAD